MQVVKPGSKTTAASSKWWVGQTITCENCRASLKLETGDKVTEYARKGAYAADGVSEQRATVHCPECGHVINFSK